MCLQLEKSELYPELAGARISRDANPDSKSYLFAFRPPSSYEIVLNYPPSVFRTHFFSTSGNANLYLENVMHLIRKGTGGGFGKAGGTKRIFY